MPGEELPLFNFEDDDQFNRLVKHLFSLKGKGVYRVELTRVRDQRSGKQNAFYWAVILPYAAKGMRDRFGEDVTSVDAHEFFKDRFLRIPVIDKASTGEVIGWRTRSTTELDKLEFHDYLENIFVFCVDYLGVVIPPAQTVEFRRNQQLLLAGADVED